MRKKGLKVNSTVTAVRPVSTPESSKK
jgi:hypothetical protein